MENRKILIILASLCLVINVTYGEVQLITKPEPGQEYVFLQTSAAGSRPVERKEKPSENERVFETAHKLPPSLTFALNKAEAEEDDIVTEPKGPAKTGNKAGKPKREAQPADAPVPAPAGAIKLDVKALLAKYKTELITSTTTTTGKPSTTKSATRSTRKPRLNPVLGGNKRTKKEAHEESIVATTASSVLTTSAAGLKPIEKDDDIPLVASGSEKQRSRIQIKKGPNGQEYEYEYVYYYYDDDDPKQSNVQDGPARNEVAPQNTASRGGSRTEPKPVTPEPATNEVLPTSRGRTRGRQLEDDDVADERLPANTRFPPRSRNLNTTPANTEEPVEEIKPRGRGRGRPESAQSAANAAENNSDSISDETQGARGRTRANVRRPSLELVDSASFNTHTSSGEPPNGSGPSFPADLPAGPVRFLGATPNERMDLSDKKDSSAESEAAPAASGASTSTDEVTTMMSAMDKVALDLYAILQGTQRLSGEDAEGNTEINTESDAETTTLEATTEILTTESTPSTTTTTTTTTTTPTPSTAAPENIFGRGKYRTRPAIGGRKPVTTSTTTEASASDTKPKNRFNRPSFGSRPRSRPAATNSEGETEQKETKEEAKPVSATRTRSRFGANRAKVTTEASEATNESKPTSTTKPSLRPRPTFNLRGRTRPTPAPEGEAAPSEDGQEASTTARSRPKLNASNVRPLRPGPRINLSGGRGRFGATTAAPAETPAEPAPVAQENQEKSNADEGETKAEAEATPAPDTNPLSRLRNRQRTPLQVRPAAPKAAASSPVQVRRNNPLISRRKPIGETSTTEAAAPAEVATEAASDADEGVTDSAPSSTTSTTEEPKGLNKLLAGRRRLALRQPGTTA